MKTETWWVCDRCNALVGRPGKKGTHVKMLEHRLKCHPVAGFRLKQVPQAKRCLSTYWVTAGCFDFIIPCERRPQHKGLHRGTRPPRAGGGSVEWDRGVAGPPKGLDPIVPHRAVGIDQLVQDLKEEQQVGCVRSTPKGLVIRPEPRRKLYRAHKEGKS